MSRCSKRQCISSLPEYKKLLHIGHSYAPCPFSTQSSDKRTRIMLRDLVYDGVNETTDLLAVHSGIDNPQRGRYIVDDSSIDALLLSELGFIRNDHSTTTGNREGTGVFSNDDYLKYPAYSGDVFMITQSHRGAWGFECAFNDCSYRQNNSGSRYYQV